MRKIVLYLFMVTVVLNLVGFKSLSNSEYVAIQEHSLYMKDELSNESIEPELDIDNFIEVSQEQMDLATTVTKLSGSVIEHNKQQCHFRG